MTYLLLRGDARNLPLADGSVALVCTSPPYNAANTESARGHVTASRGAHWANRGYDGFDDALPEDEYQAGQIAALGEVARVLKVGGSLCYVHKDRLDGGRLISPLAWLLRAGGGLVLRQIVVIDRGVTHNHNSRYFYPIHEYLFWLTKGVAHRDLGTFAGYGSIWRIGRETRPAFEHPAPFNAEIPRRCVLALSAPGDVMLDCYAGTSSTGRMAVILGRRYIGLDTSMAYLLASRRSLAYYAGEPEPAARELPALPLFALGPSL